MSTSGLRQWSEGRERDGKRWCRVAEDQWIGPRPAAPTLETEVLRQRCCRTRRDREIMLRIELDAGVAIGQRGTAASERNLCTGFLRWARPGTFKPGQSGNPSGKPKAYMQVLWNWHARTRRPRLTDFMNIVQNDDAPPVAQVAAAIVLLERAWGKAIQLIDAQIDVHGTWVIRAPSPVESAREWLKVAAPEGDDDAVIQIESPLTTTD